ncbi:hypothetical protein B9Z55_006969 [Caenorhabditis nigoni]|uniref:Uncharacterized protein n=1 Tax=Caenorhabditis nigoni TaxID=1611254 RepID=A0A2G5V7K9_9PELO|nr:hypothetical protein B9Z55_006969 [Caenorhabditis nigoni]
MMNLRTRAALPTVPANFPESERTTGIPNTETSPVLGQLPKRVTVDTGVIMEVPTTTPTTTTPNTFMSSISPKPTYTKMIMFYGKVTSPTTTRRKRSTNELTREPLHMLRGDSDETYAK